MASTNEDLVVNTAVVDLKSSGVESESPNKKKQRVVVVMDEEIDRKNERIARRLALLREVNDLEKACSEEAKKHQADYEEAVSLAKRQVQQLIDGAKAKLGASIATAKDEITKIAKDLSIHVCVRCRERCFRRRPEGGSEGRVRYPLCTMRRIRALPSLRGRSHEGHYRKV